MISTMLRGRSGAIIWILAIGLALLLPEFIPSKAALTKMCLIGIAIIFALSYNVLLGQTGLLSFGHAVYFGVSGFAAIHIINLIGRLQLPIPVFLVPLMAGVVGAVFGLLFGALSTKRHGTAFAMISLAIAELVAASSLILETFFGGELGVTTDRSLGPSFLGIDLVSQSQVYYLIVGWGVVAAGGMYAFTRTPLGRLALAVRDNPERAEFIGYSTRMIRLLAFIVSSFFAGIAGGLARNQLRDHDRREPGHGGLGDRADHDLHRRGRLFLRTDYRRHRDQSDPVVAERRDAPPGCSTWGSCSSSLFCSRRPDRGSIVSGTCRCCGRGCFIADPVLFGERRSRACLLRRRGRAAGDELPRHAQRA